MTRRLALTVRTTSNMTGSAIAKKRRQGKQPTAARSRSKTEIAAGGIVYKRTPKGVRLALIHDPYGKWTFAKGHQEAEESLEQAALRETREEMGLGRLRLVEPLGKIDIWFRDRYRKDSKGQLIHKHIHYFLFEAPARAKGQPQKKEKIGKLIWVTPAEARRLNGYPDLLPLLDKALRHLGVRPAPIERPDNRRPGGAGKKRSAKMKPDGRPETENNDGQTKSRPKRRRTGRRRSADKSRKDNHNQSSKRSDTGPTTS